MMKKTKAKVLPEEIRNKAVLYLRFSSENQTEQSIEGQRRGCIAYAKANNLTIIGEYIDRAKSATTDARPDFQKMIHDSYSGQFGIVLVWKSDRFSRQRADAIKYRTILRENGVSLLSTTEANIDGPEGILMEAVNDGFNEYYSAELSAKVQRGLAESVIKGYFIGGSKPFGYTIIDKKYTIDENEATSVKEMYRLYVYEAKTMTEIARILTASGMKWTDGRAINHNLVEKVLSSEKYKGVLKCATAVNTNAIPRLVSDETWEKAQLIRESKKHKGGAFKADEAYALVGKLYCGECGTMMVGQSGTSETKRLYSYYTCNSRIHHGCNARRWRKDLVEDYAIETIREILADNANSRLIADYLYKAQSNDTIELSSLKKALSDVDRRIQNIEVAIENGIFTKTTQGALLKLEAEKEELEINMAKENLRHRVYTKDEIKAAIEEYSSIELKTDAERKSFANTFITRIDLFSDGKMIIIANIFGKKAEAVVTLDAMKKVRMTVAPPRQFKSIRTQRVRCRDKNRETAVRKDGFFLIFVC